ncbi:putative Zinc finger, FYVE/PHD-type, Zinc finger, RING/FYVE/PHD-type, GAF-like domain superfamily [Plasmopara halstedii]
MPIEAIENEEQARIYGRARAKEIFQPMRWKRIGALPDEAAKLYESTQRSDSQYYSLRAVKPLQATLAEVEAVLTGQTEQDNSPSLLARLLPHTYVSGGSIAQYPTLDHSTRERENVTLQYARLKPYTSKHMGHQNPDTRLSNSVDNFIFLGYTLSTRLQRSDTSLKKSVGTTTPRTLTSVASLLHLYYPVQAPLFAERRHDFRTEHLADHKFSITYIIQELAKSEAREDKEASVTLEVVLTWSLDHEKERRMEEFHEMKQRLRHDALCLTRLQPLIQRLRQEKIPRNVTVKVPRESSQTSKTRDDLNQGRICHVCNRKFGPFRWKKNCEVCEKIVCHQCFIGQAIVGSRRKKRVCTQCSLREKGNGVSRKDGTVSGTTKNSFSEGSSFNVFQFPNLETLVQNSKRSEMHNRTSSQASNRIEIDLDLDPALVTSNSRRRQRTHSRQSELSQGSPMSATTSVLGVGDTRADSRRKTVSTPTDLMDKDSSITQSMRTRRAKTVQLADTPTKHVTRTYVHGSFSASSQVNTKIKDENSSDVTRIKCTSQLIKLTTPEPDYELNFNWFNAFPKAPVMRTTYEIDRANYVEVTGLKIDARSLVFLRHDTELEQFAQFVLNLASQWHGCSINIVGGYDVYCLVTASNTPELDVDDDVLELEASPVTFDDVIPREESVSAYAIHHRVPFFVAEMEHDPRFRAHPLHIEHGAVSFLSFPIDSRRDNSEAYCVATLDLWKRNHVPASSHVSNEWMENMTELIHKISARLEALALETQGFLKPRARAAHSFSSSCDSRSSTGRADSIIDMYDMENEAGGDGLSFSTETTDRLTSLSYAKVRGLGLNGPNAMTWKYDSDNESTTSSQSASSSCSQSSRFSSQLYTAADMHSTIESLLYQASKTSQYISETGVSI